MAGFNFEEVPERKVVIEDVSKHLPDEHVKITVEQEKNLAPTDFCKQEEAIKLPIHHNPYLGVEVDSKSDDILNIISFMEGSPWQVEYYSQYLGEDDETYAWSIDRA